MDANKVVTETTVMEAVERMADWYLSGKPYFIGVAREVFSDICQFEPEEGDLTTQAVMNAVFTDWVLFESDLFGGSAIENYLSTRDDDVEDFDRMVLDAIDSLGFVEFFSFVSAFEDPVHGDGVVVRDLFDNSEIRVHDAACRDRCIKSAWEPGSGILLRVAEIDGEYYAIGQFEPHDAAPAGEGASWEIRNQSVRNCYSMYLNFAKNLLNPSGALNACVLALDAGSRAA